MKIAVMADLDGSEARRQQVAIGEDRSLARLTNSALDRVREARSGNRPRRREQIVDASSDRIDSASASTPAMSSALTGSGAKAGSSSRLAIAPDAFPRSGGRSAACAAESAACCCRLGDGVRRQQTVLFEEAVEVGARQSPAVALVLDERCTTASAKPFAIPFAVRPSREAAARSDSPQRRSETGRSRFPG